MQKRKRQSLDLTEHMIVRISKRAKGLIEKAASSEQITVAAFMRRALYEATRLTGAKSR